MMNFLQIEKMRAKELADIEEVSLIKDSQEQFKIIKSGKPKWNSIQKGFRGYTDDELENLPDNIISEPIEKSTKANPFPSIARAVEVNKRKIENYLDQLSDENWLLRNNRELESGEND